MSASTISTLSTHNGGRESFLDLTWSEAPSASLWGTDDAINKWIKGNSEVYQYRHIVFLIAALSQRSIRLWWLSDLHKFGGKRSSCHERFAEQAVTTLCNIRNVLNVSNNRVTTAVILVLLLLCYYASYCCMITVASYRAGAGEERERNPRHHKRERPSQAVGGA